MRTISFEVTGQHIECTEAISDLVGNTREYVQAKFSLPTEWDGLIQIAVFTANGKNYPVLIEDGKCEVPYKVMMQEYFTVGCYAGAKTDRITTDTCVVRVEESVRCQGGSDYLSIYQKMQDTLNEMVAKVNEYEAAVENYKEIVNDTMHEHCLHETHSSDGAHGLRIHDGLFQYYDGQGWVDTKVGAFEGQSSTWKNQVVLQFAGTMRVEKVLESSYFKIQEKGDIRSSSLAPFIDSSYPYQGVQYAIYATTNQRVYVWHVQKDVNEDYGVSVERLYPVDNAESDVILRVESGKGMPVLICESNAEDVVEVVHMEYIESDLSTNRRITALEKKNNSVNNRLGALEERIVEGTWEPILYSGPGSIVNSNYLKICFGNYIRVGDYVWVECVIITTGAYACYGIGGLPYEPNRNRQSTVMPVAVINGDTQKETPFSTNYPGDEDGRNVYNDAYAEGITASSWYCRGFYKIEG